MKAKSCLSLLAAAALSAFIATSAEAQTLEKCGLTARVSPSLQTDKDPVVITLSGGVEYCASMRVAGVGFAGVLGLSQPAGALNIILAQRPFDLEPGTSCPSILVPFELEARLPSRLPVIDPPGLFPVGIYRRNEDADGSLDGQTFCGIVDLSVSVGHRPGFAFHEDRFAASVTWNIAGQDHSGFAVPSDMASPDSGLFWFFQPENWEVMVKVLDGCESNQYYWVIGAAATDVRFTLRITDAQTGAVWTYTSPGGRLAPAFADVQAFPCASPS
jgi:hypothetical protein